MRSNHMELGILVEQLSFQNNSPVCQNFVQKLCPNWIPRNFNDCGRVSARMPKICAVRNCKTGTRGVEEKRSLFRVPMNEEHRKKWEAAIPGNGQLKLTQSVCERHFLEKHVHKKWIKVDTMGQIIAQVRQRLIYWCYFGVERWLKMFI